MLNYKGYSGQIIYDDEMKILHGEVIDTRDVITFQGRSVDEVEKAFRDSIDDYLDFCNERGEQPEKSFSVKFILRMPPKLHHKLYLKANRSGKSLNKWVVETLDSVK